MVRRVWAARRDGDAGGDKARHTTVLPERALDGETWLQRLRHTENRDEMARAVATNAGIMKLEQQVVSAGGKHTVILCADEPGGMEVRTFGRGSSGQLGHGDRVSQNVPKVVETLKGKHRIVQVAAGDRHTAVLTAEGEVLTFGNGTWGQLGHGNEEGQRARW